MENRNTYGYHHYGHLEGSGPYPGVGSISQPQGFGSNHKITPPRSGTSVCFGFGGFLVLCYANNSSQILSISRTLRERVSTPDLKASIRHEAKTSVGRNQLSQEDKSRINAFLSYEKAKMSPLQGSRDYLGGFRRSCLFELLSLSVGRGYIVSNPSDYDTLFAGIKSFPELGVWRCCCEANGKPIEFVSSRSLLGLFCGTFGVSRTLEMHRQGRVEPNDSLKLEISWSDRFALSGFCGERELSSCYLDYLKSCKEESQTSSIRSGLECKCFEGILEALYLSIAQKAEHFEVSDKVLELWPHYVYSLVSSLGASHAGSRNLLTSISNGLLSDIMDQKSSLTHNEKVFGWQFCSLILGEYREIPTGLNSFNLETYITCMDIVALLFHVASKSNSGIVSSQDSVLSRYSSSLYFTELGCFERSEFYIDCISPYLSKGVGSIRSNLSKECEFLKIRIQERNMNLSRSGTNMGASKAPEFATESYLTESQVSTGTKNSSWIVGWISDNIKKAIGTEEDRWPGVENTFYFDKEINQWCQRGPDGKRITNETPNVDGSSLLNSGGEGNGGLQASQTLAAIPPPPPPPPSSQGITSNKGANTNGGIRSRYVDIFQSKK
ncbi:Uncharacterized protein CTYZ_00001036 [Cryptosporidium tyzzeri]|nr:Uncharacterized protein CTYZ_00001036 [Cryptosporidium tyzzeri]